MADIVNLLAAAAGAGGEAAETDPNFNQTVLLLHGDGSDGAQNNTFVDSSSNGFTITRNGNTTQGTFSPFSAPDGRWSNYFDGNDYFDTSANTELNAGVSEDFTISFWIYLTSSVRSQGIIGISGSNAGIYTDSSGYMYLHNGSVYLNPNTADYLSLNEWQFISIVRSSGSITFYKNGVASGSYSGAFDTEALSLSGFSVGRGRISAGVYYTTGYISNMSYVVGTAIVPSATNPTSPTAKDANTELLTCRSNRFVDNSDNTLSVTVSGNPKVTPFSPFAPTAAYSASVNGGSGYFDGSGDWIYAADNAAFTLGSSDFTIEFWMYNGTTGARKFITGQTDSAGSNTAASFAIQKNSSNKIIGTLFQSSTGYDATSTNNAPLNAWAHIAFVRDGNTTRLYINGVQDGTANVTGVTANDSSNTLSIGRLGEVTADNFPGYISGYRMVVGTCLYTGGTSFTPPTAPPTAVANTQLLCNFTNAGIFDNTGKNNLETVGNAQIDTTIKQFGTGSIELPSGVNYLKTSQTTSGTELDISTGDFTVEFWARFNTINQNHYIFNWWTSINSTTSITYFVLYGTNASIGLRFVARTGSTTRVLMDQGSLSGWSADTWYHIAFAREGNNFYMYRDGVQLGSTQTYSGALAAPAQPLLIGQSNYFASTEQTQGYLDDIRITKGVCRYPGGTTFTPPTAPFLDQ